MADRATSLLLLALALIILAAIAGGDSAGAALGWIVAGFLLAGGAYAAWSLLGPRPIVVYGAADQKKE